MVEKLLFTTTNENKLKEAQTILNIPLEGISLEIDEIQSLDPNKVITQKAIAYFQQIGKPLFVEDNSLTFEALNTLPGTYINDFSKALGNDGLIRLIENYSNRNATATVVIGYIQNFSNIQIFTGTVTGTITSEPRGDQGFGWDPIFIPNGESKTFGEMSLDEKNKYSMRTIALNKFKDWLIKSS